MKISDVLRMEPVDQFLYWCRERYNIYLKRRVGVPKPWTDDEVLRNYFFTNPYRENDKVTVWFRENVRDPLRSDPRVLLATVIFRWFNLPATADVLRKGGDGTNLLVNWSPKMALLRLDAVRKAGGQVFTGAYIISSTPGKPKLEAVIERIDNVWRDRERLTSRWTKDATMQGFHEVLTGYPGLGGFMAYEIVCDLRHTYLLEHASDKLTWCNPGPGCIRGLYRLAGEDWASKGDNSTSPPRPKDWQQRMRDLLVTCWARLPKMPRFEMREVEHSLCEFDKYCRLLHGDGRAKRTYRGV